MTLIDVAIVFCVASLLLSAALIARGPTPADRAIAADLLTFSVIGLVALIGTRLGRLGTFDLILAATLVAFLAAVSLARALTGGRR